MWFRGIFFLNPHPELMAEAPIGFQLHGMAAFLLFALWLFTRLGAHRLITTAPAE